MTPARVLSIVVPAHDEQDSLPALHAGIVEVLQERDVDFELVVVDDASEDGTWGAIARLHSHDPRVKGIRLSRNVGEHIAVWIGLKLSGGNPVVVMDADLQHPPEAIPSMLDAWKRGNAVVLMCRRGGPKAGLTRRLGASVYHNTLHWISENPIPPGHGGFALYDRSVVDRFDTAPTTPPFFRGSALTVAAATEVLHYEEAHRIHGESRHTLSSLSQTWLLAFVSTSPSRSARLASAARAVSWLCAVAAVARVAHGSSRREDLVRRLAAACAAAATATACAITGAAIRKVSRPFSVPFGELVAERVGFEARPDT
ncbi:MAG: hypothetical protein KatS3mg008_0544 [Acidimicrobiales bacterium]|nr:MAG: hypothetical protein KatS3mg008_0544 [Acidimicrobiales bacterium]